MQQARQALDVLAVDLDQHQAIGRSLVEPGVDRLDQRALAHAAGTPQQRVVGRQAVGEAARVLEQRLGHPLDAAQQVERHAGDPRHRPQPLAPRLPDEGVGCIEVDTQSGGGGGPLQRRGDPLD